MDESQSQVPQHFDEGIFEALGELDRLLYFHWDLLTDVLTFHNPKAGRIYDLPGARMEHASSQLWLDHLLHPDDIRLLHRFLRMLYRPTRRRATVHQRRLPAKLRLRSATRQSYIWVHIHTVVYFDQGHPTAIFGSIRNIQAQKAWQQRMEHQAQHDTLTGLLNKHGVKRSISSELRHASPEHDHCALLLIDADGFKEINDCFGHLFGDAVLTDMGLAIERNFRGTDIMGRIGGDEFIVLFRNSVNTVVLQNRCEALIKTLSRTYEDGEHQLKFSISIGVALYPEHGTNYEDLFRHADRALYEAKGHGKNQAVFYRPSLLSNAAVVKNERDPQSFEDFQQKAFKDNMLEYIFRLLYETNNPRATIDLTLGMFGKQFKFDRVAVDRYDKTSNQYTNAYEWLSPHGVTMRAERYDQSKQPNIIELMNQRDQMIISQYHPMAYGVLAVCPDATKLDAQYQEAREFFRVGAFAHCLITHGFDTIGCFGFECNEPHVFTQEELSDLHTFSVLLGNILLPQESDDRTKQENEHLRDVLDHLQEAVYIVDKETMVPVYMNQTVRQTLSYTFSGEPCYKRFHRRSTLCEHCPVHQLTGYEYIEKNMNNWGGVPAYTRACNLTWKVNNHPLMLMIQKL